MFFTLLGDTFPVDVRLYSENSIRVLKSSRNEKSAFFILFVVSLLCPPPLFLCLMEVWQKFLSSLLAAVAMVVSVPLNYMQWYFHGHRSVGHWALRCRREAAYHCQQISVLDWRRLSERDVKQRGVGNRKRGRVLTRDSFMF